MEERAMKVHALSHAAPASALAAILDRARGSRPAARPGDCLALGRDATLSLRPGAARSLRSLRGTLLVTQSGDPRDHVLEPGDRFDPARRGRVVAWAMTEACLEVER
jgi:Protein of unknown function (DUF2917)